MSRYAAIKPQRGFFVCVGDRPEFWWVAKELDEGLCAAPAGDTGLIADSRLGWGDERVDGITVLPATRGHRQGARDNSSVESRCGTTTILVARSRWRTVRERAPPSSQPDQRAAVHRCSHSRPKRAGGNLSQSALHPGSATRKGHEPRGSACCRERAIIGVRCALAVRRPSRSLHDDRRPRIADTSAERRSSDLR